MGGMRMLVAPGSSGDTDSAPCRISSFQTLVGGRGRRGWRAGSRLSLSIVLSEQQPTPPLATGCRSLSSTEDHVVFWSPSGMWSSATAARKRGYAAGHLSSLKETRTHTPDGGRARSFHPCGPFFPTSPPGQQGARRARSQGRFVEAATPPIAKTGLIGGGDSTSGTSNWKAW